MGVPVYYPGMYEYNVQGVQLTVLFHLVSEVKHFTKAKASSGPQCHRLISRTRN
jgi:hypothetical protein